MHGKRISKVYKPMRIVNDVVSMLLILLLLFIVCTEAFAGPVVRARRIARRTAYSACAAAAYLTAKYDAENVIERMQLDEENRAVGVLAAMSRLNTLSPRTALSACSRYRRLLRTLINAESLTVTEETVTTADGETKACKLYTLRPTKAQMSGFIGTLAGNMETDGSLFVLSRAFYTALMMVAQDATEVMAINAFENAWKSLSGADEAHIEATAERLTENNFPITFAAIGDRVYMLDAEFTFADSAVRLSYDSSGTLPGERNDGIALLVDDTEMHLDNTVSFALGDGVAGTLTIREGAEINTFSYGRTQP